MSKHRKYPIHLLRITGLEGGQYGVIDLTATSRENLELNFGGDFVELSRRDAEALIDGLVAFRELVDAPPPSSDRHPNRHHEHHRRDRGSDRPMEIIETETERVEAERTERVEIIEPPPPPRGARHRRGTSAEK